MTPALRGCSRRAPRLRTRFKGVLDPLGVAATGYGLPTENMVQAILDITVKQGIDPREAVLTGGGGAAGVNSVKIARSLG